MSLAKNSTITVTEIWDAMLKSERKISTSLAQLVFKELLQKSTRKTVSPERILDINVPAKLVDAIRNFFGGSIHFDPLWSPSSLSTPLWKLGSQLPTSIQDPLSVPWVSESGTAGNCFLPLCSTKQYSWAESFYLKLSNEICNGNVTEAVVLLKYDLSLTWIRKALKKCHAVFLYPLEFIPLATRRRSSHGRKRSQPILQQRDSYCLLYEGARVSEFCIAFEEFGLVPGQNCPSRHFT